MNETTPFWQEVSSTLMLRGDEWKQVIDKLSTHIDAVEVQAMLQSPDQLINAHMQGVAFIAGAPVIATPDSKIVLPYLPNEYLTIEAIMMQWMYQFLVLEGIAKIKVPQFDATSPLADWPLMFLDLYAKGLHFMVYMSALLCLMEEGGIKFNLGSAGMSDFVLVIRIDEFTKTEEAVKSRVQQATENMHCKTQDYGESFRRHGVVGLIPRLWDKVARYTTLKAKYGTINYEPMEDSARDLLGYSAMAWSLVLEVPVVSRIQRTEVEIG